MQEYEPIILVVDDTEDNLDLLEFALKRKPVKMLRAASGRECLVIAEQQHPDIILLDIQMPEMDGFTLTRNIKQDPRFSSIPVVIHSSLTGAANEAHVKKVGADGYVAKFVAEDLAQALRHALRSND